MQALLAPLFIYVPPFYAGEMGLGLPVAGAIFGATKLFDVLTDPVLGVFSDRLQTRWGRRRPWLVASVPVLMLSIAMLFRPEAPVTPSYFASWLLILYVGWTFLTISHISWAAELSNDYHERSRISGFKQAAGLVGALVAITIPAIFDRLPGAVPADRLSALGMVIIVALPITVGVALVSASEPPPTRVSSAPRPSLLKALRLAASHGPVYRLLAANVLMSMASGVVAGTFLFFAGQVLKLGTWSSFVLVPLMGAGLVFLPIWMRLSRRIGKHRTLCVALLYQLLIAPGILFLPTGNVAVAFGYFLMLGGNFAVSTFIPRAIMADITDADTLRFGEQRAGLFMSLLLSTNKVAGGLSVALTYPLLAWIGFDAAPDVVNSVEALEGLRWLVFLAPVGLFALTLGLMWNFPLDENEQKRLRAQIESAQSE